jgi:hypothetical protein
MSAEVTMSVEDRGRREAPLPPARRRGRRRRGRFPGHRRERSWGWRAALVVLLAGAIVACGSLVGLDRTPAALTLKPDNTIAAADTRPIITGQILGIGGRCLDDAGRKTTNGNPVTLAVCDGLGQQTWTLEADHTIRVKGYCLGVNAANASSTSAVGVYECDGAATEHWTVKSSRTIISQDSGLCLTDWQGKTVNNNPVWLNPCRASPAENWIVPSLEIDPSGIAMPVGNIPGWRQVFTDDFTENVPLGDFPAAVSNKWWDYLDGWKDTNHNGTYEPTKVVSIHNGIMNLYLHTQNGIHMVAAPVPIIPGANKYGGMLYGRYEIRFRALPGPGVKGQGYKTAWLLWPDSNNEDQGEIDFPEGNVNSYIDAFMHHTGTNPKAQDAFHTTFRYRTWHTAIIEWTANSVIFMMDGKVVGVSSDKSDIPHTSMHWVLQTETQIGGGPPKDSAYSNVQIDWVTVYRPQS